MTNRLSICLTILFVAVFKFDVVVSQASDDNSLTNSNACLIGRWFAVMATEACDGGPCDILINNAPPCKCSILDIRSIGDYGWQLFSSMLNIETSELTVTMSIASSDSSNTTEINSIALSSITMNSDIVMTEYENIIKSTVYGTPMCMKYQMSILASEPEYFYMITQNTRENGPEPFYMIWSRKRFPGKMTLWTKILEKLKEININVHSLKFIDQFNCSYPSVPQYDEMIFC